MVNAEKMEGRANARQMVIVLQMQCAVKVIIAKGDQQQQQEVNAGKMEGRANARKMVIVLQMRCAVKDIIVNGIQHIHKGVNAEEMEGRANARKMVHASIKANAALVLSVRSMAQQPLFTASRKRTTTNARQVVRVTSIKVNAVLGMSVSSLPR